MQSTQLLNQIRQLSPEEQLALANQLWDEVSQSPDVAPLTDQQRQLLDERLEEYLQNPNDVEPWEVVRDRILHQL